MSPEKKEEKANFLDSLPRAIENVTVFVRKQIQNPNLQMPLTSNSLRRDAAEGKEDKNQKNPSPLSVMRGKMRDVFYDWLYKQRKKASLQMPRTSAALSRG